MATKEEHLRELEQEDRDFAAKCREESWIHHREQRAIALAERDAAREELAKPVEQAAQSLRNSLALEVGIDPGMHIDFILRAALDRLHFMEQAAQPAAEAPAPPAPPEAVTMHAVHAQPPGLVFDIYESPAPPQETAQGGPFEWKAQLLFRDGQPVESLRSLVPILNSGLEAEQLRARVAELERHVNNYAQSYQAEKARADAAKAKLRDREDSITALEAKLGENPIPQELVRQWCEVQPVRSKAAQVLRAILAGREPGAQQA